MAKRQKKRKAAEKEQAANKVLATKFPHEFHQTNRAARSHNLFILVVPGHTAKSEHWLIYDARETGKLIVTFFPAENRYLSGPDSGTLPDPGAVVDLARRKVLKMKEQSR